MSRVAGPWVPSPIVRMVNALELRGLSGLEGDLGRLEPMLVSTVARGDPFIDEVATHLIRAGGKRLRPMLALAAATRGVRRASDEDLLGAIAVELVHLASLYHDDVIDEA
ncbi:MAG: polyprenyl synthetase family protein, partial [Acidimicrobiales bacterium]